METLPNLNNQKNIEKSDTVENVALTENIINADATMLEKCWGMMQSSTTWTGMLATVMGVYMWNQIGAHDETIHQNIIDSMQHTPTPEEIKNMLLALKVFASGVSATGISLLLAGKIHGDTIANKNAR